MKLATPELVTRLQRSLEEHVAGIEVRGTILGHLVHGGRPSYQDRAIAGRLGLAAVDALLDGATDLMVAWRPGRHGYGHRGSVGEPRGVARRAARDAGAP